MLKALYSLIEKRI